jgi:hypothetical protein
MYFNFLQTAKLFVESTKSYEAPTAPKTTLQFSGSRFQRLPENKQNG